MQSERLKFSVTKKDFDITWFSGTGAGGQYRNRHMNCCRLKHRDTGVITTGQSNRDRVSNQKEALHSMAKHPKFRSFCDLKLRELEDGMTLEQQVEEMMKEENILVQVKDDNGRWVDES